MRPRSSVEGVILYNSKEHENWVPLKVEVNSWVSLRAGRNGGHGKEAAKHGGVESIQGCFKAKVLKFWVAVGAISSVQVQHAYMWRQLDLDPDDQISSAACNYLYPSNFTDWVDPQSIMGIIVVVHAEIGELTCGNRSHAELLQDSVFFYNASYIPRSSQSTFGKLIPIGLPDFNSPDWPLPDMSTTEAFRKFFREDMHNAMRPNTGSKQTHLSWFLPIHVFIDLFAIVVADMQKTNTMFVFKYVKDELTNSLMDKGWESKITIGADVIKTTVDQASMKFRYHISRSTLYCNFVYNRERMGVDNKWEPIDHLELEQMVTIQCEMGDDWREELEVGLSWSLSDVRKEILVSLGAGFDTDFRMCIVDNDTMTRVNDRNEKNKTVAHVLPPKKLCLVVRT